MTCEEVFAVCIPVASGVWRERDLWPRSTIVFGRIG